MLLSFIANVMLALAVKGVVLLTLSSTSFLSSASSSAPLVFTLLPLSSLDTLSLLPQYLLTYKVRFHNTDAKFSVCQFLLSFKFLHRILMSLLNTINRLQQQFSLSSPMCNVQICLASLMNPPYARHDNCFLPVTTTSIILVIVIVYT